ncbi:Craniofacial development protein 2 [Varanus komodoensis]|nr:Craniofacial development protein 2 [Varanus komodoensis]
MDNPERQKDMMLEDEPLRLEGVQCATGEEQKASNTSTRKNEVTGLKPKGQSVVDLSGGERKVRCCKELYSIGTWNVRSMNQGKLDVVKQEMTRLNIDILGINELKWTGMGDFNSDDHQKRWQEYTEELYKKELDVPDNHDGVVADLEPDILECEVKRALGMLRNNKATGEYKHIMRKVGLDESPVGIKIAGRNINNLRYADDTTLMAESEEELKSLLMWVKEESAKVGLKLDIKKTKIMASGPLTSWQIDGEEMEVVADFIFRDSKIIADAPKLKDRHGTGREADEWVIELRKCCFNLGGRIASGKNMKIVSQRCFLLLEHKIIIVLFIRSHLAEGQSEWLKTLTSIPSLGLLLMQV